MTLQQIKEHLESQKIKTVTGKESGQHMLSKRNYGSIAKENYGYSIAVIDLCNPIKSDGNNLLHLVNKY